LVALAGPLLVGCAGAEDPATEFQAESAQSFGIHLSGLYNQEPQGAAKMVGGMDVAAGDWCATRIYPHGVSEGQGVAPIGTFWFQFDGGGAAWQFSDGQLGAEWLNFHGAMVGFHGHSPGYIAPPGSMTMVSESQLLITGGSGAEASYVGGKDAMSFKAAIVGDGPCDLIEDCDCRFTH
jgi:hypothetical protein